MSIFSQIFFVGSIKRFFSARVRFGPSRPSKVIDFGTNQKRICSLLLVVMCEYSKFRIEYLLAIRFNSKLTQLFEIFEYLFNRDQPGDWHATCCTLPATSRSLTWCWIQCCARVFLAARVCSYPSHSPDHARESQLSAVLSVSIVTDWHGDMLHLKYVVMLVLPMWYCRSRLHMPHAVSSAPHTSEKPPQLSYSQA